MHKFKLTILASLFCAAASAQTGPQFHPELANQTFSAHYSGTGSTSFVYRGVLPPDDTFWLDATFVTDANGLVKTTTFTSDHLVLPVTTYGAPITVQDGHVTSFGYLAWKDGYDECVYFLGETVEYTFENFDVAYHATGTMVAQAIAASVASPVPEPGTLALVGFGLLAIGRYRMVSSRSQR